MREVVEIEGREAVPLRAVPFLTDWRWDEIPGRALPKVSGLFCFFALRALVLRPMQARWSKPALDAGWGLSGGV